MIFLEYISRQGVVLTSTDDTGRWQLGVVEAAYKQRDIAVGQWLDGFRMDHTGSIVSHLGGFRIAELLDKQGIRYQLGVGCQDALHIFPDSYLAGIQAGGKDSCGIVGAFLTQGNDIATGAAADIALRHHNLLVKQGAYLLLNKGTGLFPLHMAIAEMVIAFYQFRRQHPCSPQTLLLQKGRNYCR